MSDNKINNNWNNELGSGPDQQEKPIPQEMSSTFSRQIMNLSRCFSTEGKSPFEFDIFGNPINWIAEDVSVTDDAGKTIFTQPDVKRPDFWSPLSIKVVANKYFWGDQNKGERENSVKDLIGRVSRFFGRQATEQKYFTEDQATILKDEISAICLNQLAAFNSPVWFNAGIWENDKNAGGVSTFKWDREANKVVKANKGDDRPQCSACFIQSMTDDMESIMSVQVAEANLFRSGSGTGSNRSNLRSSREKLTGGGRASGPVSFMKGYDAYAGIIKSGGKTRRAAKMEILNIDHPDIMEFINAKQTEEKKAWALIKQGYDGGMNGDAYSSVAFQNCNMSVRIPDVFMKAVKEEGEWKTHYIKSGEPCETFKAKEIMKKISEGTHICGDPGVQFDTIINKWHTCKNSARINASNPCVTGDTMILTEDGRWKRIDSILDKETTILTNTGIIQESKIKGSFKTGTKPVYKLQTKNGYELKLTADHKVFTVNRGFVQACELSKEDYILLPSQKVVETVNIKDECFYQMLGVYLGDGCGTGKTGGIQFTMHKEKEISVLEKFSEYVSTNYKRMTHKNTPATIQITKTTGKYVITNNILKNKIKEFIDLSLNSHQKQITEKMFNLTLSEQKYILQGIFTADGTVANYGEKSQYVALDSTSLPLIKGVQLLLLGFGIKSKIYENRRAGKSTTLLPDGKGGLKEYNVREIHSLRISRSSRIKFEKLIGFMPESYKNKMLRKLNENVGVYMDKPIDSIKSLEYLGVEKVYDLAEPITHTFIANGITIHNCSEYMFVDDSACNLASINLLKFLTEDRRFDVASFKKTIRPIITAMELSVEGSTYPTEKITENSRNFRPLGLGYTNLGALLMSLGLPYDSDAGRAVAAAITAILSAEAYKTSAEIAGLVGPFPEYENNKDCMLDVIKMHRDSVKKIDVEKTPIELRYLINDAWDSWTNALELGEKNGYKNAQVTVLAPTGTIAFMMGCDTTGIEPDIALVKYKVLSGGGMLKIVNNSVERGLLTLGYNKDQIKEIISYINKNETIEGAPHILESHLAVFDCAFKATKGKRAISYKGHVKMMGATQPFLSGAISKTINMSEESTVEDITEAYLFAWEQGLKAVAIYRENSKRSQPLNTQKTEGEVVKKKDKIRTKLPQTRKSVTHKFDIAGHEGYITVGLYDDGGPGEIFVTMHKQGSTIRGLMDAWATSVSLNLQRGYSIKELFGKFRHHKFEPAGFVKNVEGGEVDSKIKPIRTASSIVDYVSQFMLNNFGEGSGGIDVSIKEFGPSEEQASLEEFANEGLTCPICGGPAKRIGNCAIMCTSCKQTTRNGCGE